MKKQLFLSALAATALVSLAGCGEAKEAKLVGTYITSRDGTLALPDYQMTQACVDNYVVRTYSDNTYEMTLVKYMDMYGTDGSVTIKSSGSYSSKENADGDKVIALSDAQDIIYTTSGMFNMQYSWNTGLQETEWPVELLGGTSAHFTLDDLKNEFGQGFAFTVVGNTKEGQGDCIIGEFVTDVQFEGKAAKHVKGKKEKGVYITSVNSYLDLPDYGMKQDCKDNYVLTVFEDNTYEMTLVKYMDMYGTKGSVTVDTKGKVTSKENADGDIVLSVGDAESIVYTTSGMFNMQYSWNTGLQETAFPVELLGGTSAHFTLEDLKNGFGKGFDTVIVENTKEGQGDCIMTVEPYVKQEEPSSSPAGESTPASEEPSAAA